MRQMLVGLLLLPAVVGVSATARMPMASARVDDPAAVSGGVHAAARLARWMTGRFEAPAQHTEHGTLPAVSLRSCLVSVPTVGERVLYTERAFVLSDGSLGRPFEQRLYAIEPFGLHATVRVREFGLVDPAGVRNLCEEPAPTVAPALVEERSDCSLRLRTVGAALRGATEGAHCPSTINGADHVTRTLSVTSDSITLEEQGFDANAQVVWSSHGAQHYTRVGSEG